jgi:hypothetical protein
MFSNKRGVSTELFIVGWALLALLVAVALFAFIRDVASESLFERNFMARDAALLTDAIYASPGDISFVYDTKVAPNKALYIFTLSPEQRFVFAFVESRAKLYKDLDDQSPRPVQYPFAEDAAIHFLGTQRLFGNLLFKKTGTELIIEALPVTEEQMPEDFEGFGGGSSGGAGAGGEFK